LKLKNLQFATEKKSENMKFFQQSSADNMKYCLTAHLAQQLIFDLPNLIEVLEKIN
jgi:hypothetical protein